MIYLWIFMILFCGSNLLHYLITRREKPESLAGVIAHYVWIMGLSALTSLAIYMLLK